MTVPRQTPNPATATRPDRSSKRVARKSPLGWLPWALLGLLALLLLLVLLIVNAVDDDGPEGSAGDSLGQVSDSDGAPSSTPSSTSRAPSSQAPGSSEQPDLGALSASALVGGGAVTPGPAGQAAPGTTVAEAPGTAGVVLFAEASAELDQAGKQVVTAAAEALRSAGVSSVTVVGHTDEIAGDPVNDTLSQERAVAVAAALASQLPELQISTSARGQDQPVADNGTEQGRQLNRRAVITAQA